jgi:hypothetical protein
MSPTPDPFAAAVAAIAELDAAQLQDLKDRVIPWHQLVRNGRGESLPPLARYRQLPGRTARPSPRPKGGS